MKFLSIFQVFLFSLFILSANDIINLGELTREEGIKPIKIQFQSSDSTILNIAQKAFQLHGGFQISTDSTEDFLIRLTPIESNSVELSIESGTPKVSQFKNTFTASNLREATLQACNQIIKKTLGIPGFFTGKLVFVGKRSSSRELFIADILFNDVRQLTKDSVDIVSPKFSPNGKKIVYTSYYKTGFPDIFMIDIASGSRTTVAGYEGTNTGACFSPQGNQLAMILSSRGNAELFIANASGKGLKKLTNTKALEATPTWSNDGQFIYFSSDPMGSPQIYRIKASGGAPERIPTNISKYCAEPTLNPLNNDLMAFTAAVNKQFQVALYDASREQSIFLNTSDADFMEPCWLNDGRHLIVTKRVGDNTQLHILDSLTKRTQQLHQKSFGNSMMAHFNITD